MFRAQLEDLETEYYDISTTAVSTAQSLTKMLWRVLDLKEEIVMLLESNGFVSDIVVLSQLIKSGSQTSCLLLTLWKS